MPTRRLNEGETFDEWQQAHCASPDHEPAKHRVYEPGLYEHKCSGCGKITYFRVYGVMYHAPKAVV